MSRVRPDHLAFALNKLISMDEKERKDLQDGVRANKSMPRSTALAKLGDALPEERLRLEAIWAASSRQTLFLWELPALAEIMSSKALKSEVASAVARTLGEPFGAERLSEKWTRLEELTPVSVGVVESDEEDEEESVDAVPAPPPRVIRVRATDESIDVTIRTTRYTHFVYEDESKRYPITSDVGLSISLTGERPVAKVFGGQQIARKAVRAFVEWLTNNPLPRRNPALGRHIRPVKFTESDVKRLAEKMDLELIGIGGDDGRDVLGKVQFDGKMNGYRKTPLDLEDDRLKSQEDLPQDARAYNWDYEHPEDKFVEPAHVVFVFDSQHSHIRFRVRMSEPAVASVVEALYAVL